MERSDMVIIVDAMGGDNAPDAIVRGTVNAAINQGVKVKLVGREADVTDSIRRMGIAALPGDVELINASQVIGFDDDPATATREKKDSSLTVGLTLLRDGEGDAFVSAGNTGALLTGATLIVKRVRGVRRAAMAPVIPSSSGSFILIDCGANAECTPEYLLQFAYMGSFYAQNILELDAPRVGLLNNGAERSKGTALQLETYELLKKTGLNFIGNIEAKDALKGGCDVLVSDGFSGNIMLKTIEGAASLIMGELKSIYMSNHLTKLSALLVKGKMSGIKRKMDPDTTGGTALLGISKPVIKAHGGSGADAIANAIARAAKEAVWDIASKLLENAEKMKISQHL